MEKRTILAFILAFFVLIGWSYFFTPEDDRAPEKTSTRTETPPSTTSDERTPAEFPVETTVPPDEKPAPRVQKAPEIPRMQEREIIVETPLYRAVFSNDGPTIKSFKLKKYSETSAPDSPRIDLVRLQEKSDRFLGLDFPVSAGNSPEKGAFKLKQEEDIYLKEGSDPKAITFNKMTANGLIETYTFIFFPDRYGIDLKADISNNSSNTVTGNPTVSLAATPAEGKSRYYSYVGLVALVDDELEEMELEEDEPEKKMLKGHARWLAYEDDYFISAVVPQRPGKALLKGELLENGVIKGSYIQESVSLAPMEKISTRYGLYFGPRNLDNLEEEGSELHRAVSFGWTDIIAKPLLHVLKFFNTFINNFGLSIILLTIIIKILFWPLTHKSYKSMKEMQKLQPRMAKIREKHKGDKQKLNQEMMALYKTYKVNPMSGCFPMLIQIPVFLALFRILGSAIELRHAPFALWINDLSAPDRLFRFPFEIPFMAPPYGIPVLTLLMGASMFIQQKMTPTPGDPTQAKIMMFLPIIFTFVFINFPSGLVLYWLVNNILSIGQQYRIHKAKT